MPKERGNPQLEDGFTPIANELLEAIARISLSPYESSILFAIIRRTYGWQKKMDYISNSQLAAATGIRKPHVTRTVKELLHRNIVTSRGNSRVKQYGIQKNHTLWAGMRETPPKAIEELLPAEVTELPAEVTTLTSRGNVLLPVEGPTKETIEKETIQKNRGRKEMAPDPRIKEGLEIIANRVGYQIPNYAKEGAAIKRALAMGFTLDQVIACWERLKTFAFWGGRWLPLAAVTENLGEFVAGRLEDGRTRGDPGKAAPRRAEVRRREEFESPFG